MFKILIADDEKYIRKGICSILERNLGEEIVCIEAQNGLEALRITEHETPNLIITDISMPGCDGLEFVKQLKAKQVNTTIIILSGYENFEYAKQAIALGIREYVMKPIKKPEFIELIQRHINDIRRQQLKTGEIVDQRIKNNQIIEGVKREFLVSLLKCSNNQEARQYVAQLKELKINVDPQLCTCVVFQYEVSESNREYMDFVVKNILDEYLSTESKEFLLTVTYDVGKTIGIFKSGRGGGENEMRKKLIRDAARLIREYGKVRVFVGIGDTAPDFEHLNGTLRHALEAVDYKIFDSGDILCSYEKIKPGLPLPLPVIDPPDHLLTLWNEFNRIYSLGQTQAVMNALKMRYNQASEYIKHQAAKKAIFGKQEEIMGRDFSQCWTLDELKQELKQGLGKLETLKENGSVGNAQLMEEILRFVDENITGELDLNCIAGRFHRTPGYISTLFKRYDKGGFNYYVTEKRLEIAKGLLKNPNISIQAVAEACGYYNAKYFSVVFKKSVGQTPREYREQR